jgi:RES domain
LITATLNAELHDLRALRAQAPELYDAHSYQASQPFGARLRRAASWGIVYSSVRLEAGQCAGVFRPRAVSHAVSAAHIALHWDGQRVTHWYQKQGPIAVRH